MDLKAIIEKALREALNGKFSEELRTLYNMPFRDQVVWTLFPDWARPNDPVEGCHEG